MECTQLVSSDSGSRVVTVIHDLPIEPPVDRVDQRRV